MDIKGNLDTLMREAQKMQDRMKSAQEELVKLVVIGEAGAGLVKVHMNGRHNVLKTEVNKTLLEEDVDMIEDLVTAAVNDAVNKIERESRGKISALTQGLNLPPEFTTPPGGDDQGSGGQGGTGA